MKGIKIPPLQKCVQSPGAQQTRATSLCAQLENNNALLQRHRAYERVQFTVR